MNRDEVSEIVEAIATRVAREPGMSDATFVVHVYARVRDDAPEVSDYIRDAHPGTDPYQALKWFIPDHLGFSTS
jgi:hypothetical protein